MTLPTIDLTSPRPVRVLIVDDSAIVRRTLTKQLGAQEGIEVVGTAPNPYVARDMILQLQPDAITLDIEMPRMDGLTFLRKLMKHHPVPTVVVSSLTPESCQMSLDCLAAGAMHVCCKPSGSFSLGELGEELGNVLRNARSFRRRPAAKLPTAPIKHTALSNTTDKVVAIGASTGGTEALGQVLAALPKTCPGVLIVQHMPPGFTTTFANRLNGISQLNVREAVDGEPIIPGQALLAPGATHLSLARDGARYIARVSDGPRVKRHKPSVDVLFNSVAKQAGSNAIGVIMTGMGDDGADALGNMREAGAITIGQDEASCVVFGMPKAAHERGSVDRLVPLERIAGEIVQFAAGRACRAVSA